MSNDRNGIVGHVVAEKYNEDGLLVARIEVDNKVTDTGDQFYGARAALIQSATVSITAITNATTAVVTTSAAHNFGVGDVVTIAGVTPSGYNGQWAITAVGSTTTFSIYVGTALGAGTAFGTAKALAQPPASGMKLGTDTTTAAAKNGAGAALVTYLSGSNLAFDSTFPTSTETPGSGDAILYRVTWGAGVATTASAIGECVIVNEWPLANATTAAANTISRVQLTGIGSKGASDTLQVSWTHTLLGA